MTTDRSTDADRLRDLLSDLLVKDVDRHERALSELARVGDERVVGHLVEVAALDAVANDWGTFGFPEVLRDRDPPYAFRHPDVRFPGVIDALRAVAPPDYDDERVAWLQWESWFTQTDPPTLDGYLDWKVRFHRTYNPEVGHLLDVEPRREDFDAIRWGSTTPSALHPLNGPEFVPADAADHVRDEDLVYGFTVEGQAYAVPRYLLFPHEFLNADLEGRPIALSYCTMCNSPIVYDRRFEDRELQFGSSGCLWNGNKAMYDLETGSIWNQGTGRPIAGPMLARDRESESQQGDQGVSLDFLPVTQATYGEWTADNPETLVLGPDTGYDYDYEYYRDYDGFIASQYWGNESVTYPGVREPDDPDLDSRTYVYVVEGDERAHVFPVETVEEREPTVHEIDGTQTVAVAVNDDIAVYEAPPLPVECEGTALVDTNGRRWTVAHDGLRSDDRSLDRISGRHGLWLAFRSEFGDEYVLVGE